jgi:uncharacterized membrane protein (UPF0127 family)
VRKVYRLSWYLVIFAALLGCGLILWRQKSLSIVYTDQQPVIVEVASSEKARTQGLSGRSSLAMGHGMMFVFEAPAAACMWMKDMNFDLDVYWYSSTGNLVGSHKNVKATSFPRLYCPEIPATYMLEVNAGQFSAAPKKLSLPVNQ